MSKTVWLAVVYPAARIAYTVETTPEEILSWRHWQTSRQANKSSIARQGRRRSTAALHEDTAYCTLIERDRIPE